MTFKSRAYFNMHDTRPSAPIVILCWLITLTGIFALGALIYCFNEHRADELELARQDELLNSADVQEQVDGLIQVHALVSDRGTNYIFTTSDGTNWVVTEGADIVIDMKRKPINMMRVTNFNLNMSAFVRR